MKFSKKWTHNREKVPWEPIHRKHPGNPSTESTLETHPQKVQGMLKQMLTHEKKIKTIKTVVMN